ncbi:MAG: helix-turn-helix transcriptional regulator [Bacteroidales bacterium]|nr:helix-turn-helix transcriptional regulator [Bacteroidales bacterium]
MVLSDTIKERRAQLKISQIDLAEMAGVSLATVKDIERGKGNPCLQTVEKILAVLGMVVVYQLRQTI